MGMGYVLQWKAPIGRTANADLDGTHVSTNDPVRVRTWWAAAAAVLASKIAYGNESLTPRVCATAEKVETYGDEWTEVNGWQFRITEWAA